MRRPRYKPACQQAFEFLRARGVDLAPVTGQDRRALEAWFQLVELWGTADDAGTAAALNACAHVLDGMQREVWYIAKAGIPGVMDWTHEAQLWSAVHALREQQQRAP